MDFIRIVAFILPIFLAIYIGSKYKVSGTKLFFLILSPSFLFGVYMMAEKIVRFVIMGNNPFEWGMLTILLTYTLLGTAIMLPALFLYGVVLLALEKHLHLQGIQLFVTGALVGFMSGLFYGVFIVNEFSNKLFEIAFLPTITGAFSIVILNYFIQKIAGDKS